MQLAFIAPPKHACTVSKRVCRVGPHSAAFFGPKGVRNCEMADLLWYSHSCQTSYSRVVHLRIEGTVICLSSPSQFFCVLRGWCCEYQQALIDRSLSVRLVFSKFHTFFFSLSSVCSLIVITISYRFEKTPAICNANNAPCLPSFPCWGIMTNETKEPLSPFPATGIAGRCMYQIKQSWAVVYLDR